MKSLKIACSVMLIWTLMVWQGSYSVEAGELGPHIRRLVETHGASFAGDRFGRTFDRWIDGKKEIFAHVFIKADLSALPAIRARGCQIFTVTSGGIITAQAPIDRLAELAELDGVQRIEVGRTVKKLMDISAGTDGVNLPQVAYPRSDNTGKGVIVGIIDTGIDIGHPDFIDSQGQTRILSIWDHTLDTEDVGGIAGSPDGFSYGTEWSREIIQQGYGICLHRDYDGHGTHVAGTAAGNGRAQSYKGPYTGIAPEADLLIVKFDFDNIKSRNSDTMILDGINWIFQQAAGLGRPCVINMSLGSDYGPHDGSTPEERGIDDLVGPNRIVCIAAGNAGSSYAGPAFEQHGGPIHGSGSFSVDHDIVMQTGSDYVPDSQDSSADYLFFDIWYSGQDSCRVQITAPSGKKYPSNFGGRYRNLWVTGGKERCLKTPEGTLCAANTKGANSSWNSDNEDNNLYIEISDVHQTKPAGGLWVIDLIPLNGNGAYQAWHGFSSSLSHTYFWYDSGSVSHTWGDPSDPSLSTNRMTVGSPATALEAISLGAYQTKNTWPGRLYADWTSPESPYSLIWQAYGVAPVNYYNPFYLMDLAYFSSRGPSRDGRTQPFIAAPGVGIVASLSESALNNPNETYYRRTNRVEFGGNHTVLQGTSMSCPHTTGVVALLLEKAHRLGLSPTPTDIKAYIKAGSRHDAFTGLDPQNPEDSNDDWGYGKLDATGALSAILQK
ncbi:MAG: S8 family serine peptidase [Deltaproteobacteria bacterium]|nr:S8 family serine peptidase [Deltaproteobacteria bacterium]